MMTTQAVFQPYPLRQQRPGLAMALGVAPAWSVPRQIRASAASKPGVAWRTAIQHTTNHQVGFARCWVRLVTPVARPGPLPARLACLPTASDGQLYPKDDQDQGSANGSQTKEPSSEPEPGQDISAFYYDMYSPQDSLPLEPAADITEVRSEQQLPDSDEVEADSVLHELETLELPPDFVPVAEPTHAGASTLMPDELVNESMPGLHPELASLLVEGSTQPLEFQDPGLFDLLPTTDAQTEVHQDPDTPSAASASLRNQEVELAAALREETAELERQVQELAQHVTARTSVRVQASAALNALRESQRKVSLLEAMVLALRERLSEEETRNEALTSEVQSSKAELESVKREANARIEGLRSEVKAAYALLKEASARTRELEQQVKELTRVNEALQNRVGDLEQEVAAHTAAAAQAASEAEQRIADIQASAAAEAARVAALQQCLSEREAQLREAQDELAASRQAALQSTIRFAELHEERDDLARVKSAMQQALASREADVAAREADIRRTEMDLAVSKEAMQQALAARDHELRLAREEVKRNTTASKQALAAREAELIRAQEELDRVAAAAEATQQALANTESSVAAREADVRKTQMDLAVSKEAMQQALAAREVELRLARSELRRTNKTSKETLAAVEAQYNETKADLDKVTAAAEATQQALTIRETELADAKAELDKGKGTLDQLNSLLNLEEQQLVQAEEKALQAEQHIQAISSEAKQNLSKAQALVHEREQQVAELKQQLSDAMAKAERESQAKIAELAAVRGTLEAALAAARLEVHTSHQQLSQMQGEVESLLGSDLRALMGSMVAHLPGSETLAQSEELRGLSRRQAQLSAEITARHQALEQQATDILPRMQGAQASKAQFLRSRHTELLASLQQAEKRWETDGSGMQVVTKLRRDVTATAFELTRLLRNHMTAEQRAQEQSLRSELEDREAELKSVTADIMKLRPTASAASGQQQHSSRGSLAALLQQRLRELLQERDTVSTAQLNAALHAKEQVLQQEFSKREATLQQQTEAREAKQLAELKAREERLSAHEKMLASKRQSELSAVESRYKQELEATRRDLESKLQENDQSLRKQLDAAKAAAAHASNDRQRLAAEVTLSAMKARQQLADLTAAREELAARSKQLAEIKQTYDASRAAAERKAASAAAEAALVSGQVQALQQALQDRQVELARFHELEKEQLLAQKQLPTSPAPALLPAPTDVPYPGPTRPAALPPPSMISMSNYLPAGQDQLSIEQSGRRPVGPFRSGDFDDDEGDDDDFDVYGYDRDGRSGSPGVRGSPAPPASGPMVTAQGISNVVPFPPGAASPARSPSPAVQAQQVAQVGAGRAATPNTQAAAGVDVDVTVQASQVLKAESAVRGAVAAPVRPTSASGGGSVPASVSVGARTDAEYGAASVRQAAMQGTAGVPALDPVPPASTRSAASGNSSSTGNQKGSGSVSAAVANPARPAAQPTTPASAPPGATNNVVPANSKLSVPAAAPAARPIAPPEVQPSSAPASSGPTEPRSTPGANNSAASPTTTLSKGKRAVNAMLSINWGQPGPAAAGAGAAEPSKVSKGPSFSDMTELSAEINRIATNLVSGQTPQVARDTAPPPAAAPAQAAATPAVPAAAVPATQPVLQLVLSGCCIPHEAKADRGGEDAFFVDSANSSLGVADGVGSWAVEGVDVAAYARGILQQCQAALNTANPAVGPKQALAQAHARVELPGSCTACVAILRRDEKLLEVANLGDSGLRIVRGKQVIAATAIQEHTFNMPYQMAHPDRLSETDTADDAQVYKFPVEAGDIIIMATDGLWDNLWDEQVIAILTNLEQASQGKAEATAARMAKRLTEAAQAAGRDERARTPWAVESAAASGSLLARMFPRGGKMDDVTCVVALVVDRLGK